MYTRTHTYTHMYHATNLSIICMGRGELTGCIILHCMYQRVNKCVCVCVYMCVCVCALVCTNWLCDTCVCVCTCTWVEGNWLHYTLYVLVNKYM